MDGDLISRKELLKKAKTLYKVTDDVLTTVSVVTRTDIVMAPAVDAEPVRHARWLDDDRYFGHGERCSACASGSTGHGRNKYCPNCGARMDGRCANDV